MVAIADGQIHLLNEYEVAQTLGVSVATVRRWRLFQQGPRYYKVGSLVKYKAGDVATWLDCRPTGGGTGVTRD